MIYCDQCNLKMANLNQCQSIFFLFSRCFFSDRSSSFYSDYFARKESLYLQMTFEHLNLTWINKQKKCTISSKHMINHLTCWFIFDFFYWEIPSKFHSRFIVKKKFKIQIQNRKKNTLITQFKMLTSIETTKQN